MSTGYAAFAFLPQRPAPQAADAVGRLEQGLRTSFTRSRSGRSPSTVSREPVWGEESSEYLAVGIDDWSISIAYRRGAEAVAEAQRAAQHVSADDPKQFGLRACDAMFELSASPDPDLDHVNDYVFVLEQIEAQYPGAVLFDPNDDSLI